MYEVALLGGTALDGPQGPMSGYATQSRQMALLALLGTAGNAGLSRDKLLAYLFPESRAASARHSLTDAVYRLRKALGHDAVLGGAAKLRLNPDLIRCDVQSFETAVGEGELEKAVGLYRGPFLDGFHLRESTEFEQWKDVEARRLALMYEGALETLADGAESSGDYVAAVGWWTRLVEHDPLNSRNAERLIEAQAEAGDPANAVLYAEQHADLLRRDLSVEPPDELRELVERIRRSPTSFVAGSGARRARGIPRLRFSTRLARRRSRARWALLARTKRRSAGRWSWVAAPLAVAAIGAVVWLGARGTSASGDTVDGVSAEAGGPVLRAEETDRLVVVPLENLSEPELDEWRVLAADRIAHAIGRTGAIAVVPPDGARDAWGALGAGGSAVAVARRVGATYDVTGRFAHTDSDVRFDLELVRVRDEKSLVTLDPIGGPIDSIEAVVDRAAEAVAAAVMAQLDPQGEQWMHDMSPPPRPDVYRDYLRSYALSCQGRYEEAIEAGDRALAKSPHYVSALLLNGWSYESLGRSEEADSVFSQLEGLREQMMPTERASLGYANAYMRGHVRDAVIASEDGYRQSPVCFADVAGRAAAQERRLEDAIALFKTADLETPCAMEGVAGWLAAAWVDHLLERYGEELAWVRTGLEQHANDLSLMEAEARAFAATGRLEAVDSVLDAMAVLPPSGDDPDFEVVLVALELRAHGHKAAADATFARALAGFAAQPPDMNRYDRGRAFYYAGHWADADTLFAGLIVADEPVPPEEAILASRDVEYRGFRGASLARLGRPTEALEIDHWLEAIPERPGLRGANLRWQAIIHATMGDQDGAVRLMGEALDHFDPYGLWVHLEPAFDSMWDYPPWEKLLEPR